MTDFGKKDLVMAVMEFTPPTDENAQAWSELWQKYQERQFSSLADWANMLENPLKELDPNYRASQFGRSHPQDAIVRRYIDKS